MSGAGLQNLAMCRVCTNKRPAASPLCVDCLSVQARSPLNEFNRPARRDDS